MTTANMKRKMTKRSVNRRTRIYRVVTVKRTVWQCERPYVLFGKALRKARAQRGMTQQDLADAIELTRTSIANIELGRQRVLLSDVFDFAKVLRIKPALLFSAAGK